MPADRLYRVLGLLVEKGWSAALSARAVRVCIVLLHHYNWRTKRAFPGYELLCRETGLSRDTIAEALRELEFYGLWLIERTHRRPNVYRLPECLVPEVPAEAYASSPRYARRDRLSSLRQRTKAKELASRAPRRLESRACLPVVSRASGSLESRAVDWNYEVELRSNHEKELRRAREHDFQSPRGQGPKGNSLVRAALAAGSDVVRDVPDAEVAALAGAVGIPLDHARDLVRLHGLDKVRGAVAAAGRRLPAVDSQQGSEFREGVHHSTDAEATVRAGARPLDRGWRQPLRLTAEEVLQAALARCRQT